METTADIVRAKRRVALSSVLAALAITSLKLFIGLQTNSLGILSEAAHSGLDLLAALITLFAVAVADRPPDRDHMYGHGKVENVSAFVESLLLVVTCAWIIWEAVNRLTGKPTHVDATAWGFIVIGLSIVVDFSRSRALKRAAVKYKSQALEADALHFSSDIWSSMVVLGGLLFVSLGFQTFDAVAAIIVAVLVLLVTYRLGKRTIDALMDRIPASLSEEIRATISAVDGVAGVLGLRVRSSGSKLFIDSTVAIARTIPFQQAHDIMDNIEKAVRSRYKDADVVIHSEPLERADESIAEKVQMITLAHGLGTPHNLEVARKEGRYHIDFDIEYPTGKDFVEAHDRTSAIEEEIRRKIPEVEKVTIHMEEFHHDEHETAPEAGTEGRLRHEISACIASEPRVLRFSGLTLLRVDDQYNLSVNCQIEKSRSLEESHQIVSELEAKLYKRFKILRRITIHAEPD